MAACTSSSLLMTKPDCVDRDAITGHSSAAVPALSATSLVFDVGQGGMVASIETTRLQPRMVLRRIQNAAGDRPRRWLKLLWSPPFPFQKMRRANVRWL